MNERFLLEYQNKLKSVYVKSQLQACFIADLGEMFKQGEINRIISISLNHSPDGVFCSGGFYPCCCRYTLNELNIMNRYYEDYKFGKYAKRFIKKELLRRIFLLTFERFLSNRKYGIDFRSYYKIPVNQIQFTFEYQNSGKLYRDFFNESIK